MRDLTRTLALALGVLLASIAPAIGAQGAPSAGSAAKPVADRATPVWYAVTFGGAGARLTCDLCQPSRDVGVAFSLAAGVHARPRLRVGLEAGRWSYENEGVRERMHSLGLVAQLVPNASRGFYLLGGAGWSGYRAGEFSYDAPRLTVGLGWDIPFTGEWVIGNVLALDAASGAPLRNEDVTVMRDVGLSSVRLAIQLQRR